MLGKARIGRRRLGTSIQWLGPREVGQLATAAEESSATDWILNQTGRCRVTGFSRDRQALQHHFGDDCAGAFETIAWNGAGTLRRQASQAWGAAAGQSASLATARSISAALHKREPGRFAARWIGQTGWCRRRTRPGRGDSDAILCFQERV